ANQRGQYGGGARMDVVEQDDAAAHQRNAVEHALRDGFGDGIGPVHRINVPQHHLHLLRGDVIQDLVVDRAVGRTEERRVRLLDGAEQLVGGFNLLRVGRRVQFGEQGVAVGVIRERRAFVHHVIAGGGGRGPFHLAVFFEGPQVAPHLKEHASSLYFFRISRMPSVYRGCGPSSKVSRRVFAGSSGPMISLAFFFFLPVPRLSAGGRAASYSFRICSRWYFCFR